MQNNKVVLNLKMPDEKRNRFKRVAKDNGMTMQSVLSAFVEFYIKNPEIFKMKLELEFEKN